MTKDLGEESIYRREGDSAQNKLACNSNGQNVEEYPNGESDDSRHAEIVTWIILVVSTKGKICCRCSNKGESHD